MSTVQGSPLILLVDSNDSELSQAAEALTREGLRVATASTIEEAESVLDTSSVDLVLIDLQLSEISGHDFADYLREAKQVTAPIVLWSSLNPDRLASLIAECGAAGAIRKDVNMDNLSADLKKFFCSPPAAQIKGQP